MEINDDTPLRNYYYYNVRDDLFYKTDININGFALILTIGYNTRLKKRYASIETTATTVILPRTFLDVKRACSFNINSTLLGIGDYYISIYKIDDNKADDFLNWSSNYRLVIGGMNQETKEAWDKLVKEVAYFS